MSLKKTTYIALFWSFVDRAGEQLIRFIFSVVLARLLIPADFGLLGMAYVVTEIARNFVQGGMGLGLINKENATKTDECSLFYANIFLGAFSVVVIFFIAPYIGLFYKNENIILILRVLSINIFIGSFGTIQNVLMTKNIDFRAQTKVSLTATLVSGVIGIVLALKNFGVWSLVYQNIIRSILYSSMMWVIHKWRPMFLFSFGSLKELFGYGSKVLFGNLAQVFFNNIYIILIGKFFNPVQLGYYTRAQQTQQLPIDTLFTILWRVSFPVLSKLKGEPERFRNALRKVSGNIAFVIFPSMAFAAMLAPCLFRLLFGEKWIPSIVMFQVLCAGSIFLPLEQIRNNSILAKGNSTLQFILLMIKYSTTLVSIMITFRFGIIPLLISFGIVSYLNFLLNAYFVKKEIGYLLKDQFLDIVPPLFATGLACAIMYLVIRLLPGFGVLQMGSQLAAGTVVYVGICFLLKIDALNDNILLLKSVLSKRATK